MSFDPITERLIVTEVTRASSPLMLTGSGTDPNPAVDVCARRDLPAGQTGIDVVRFVCRERYQPRVGDTVTASVERGTSTLEQRVEMVRAYLNDVERAVEGEAELSVGTTAELRDILDGVEVYPGDRS